MGPHPYCLRSSDGSSCAAFVLLAAMPFVLIGVFLSEMGLPSTRDFFASRSLLPAAVPDGYLSVFALAARNNLKNRHLHGQRHGCIQLRPTRRSSTFGDRSSCEGRGSLRMQRTVSRAIRTSSSVG